jgi:hypothetical protein
MPLAQRAGSRRNTGFFDLAAMKSPNPHMTRTTFIGGTLWNEVPVS